MQGTLVSQVAAAGAGYLRIGSHPGCRQSRHLLVANLEEVQYEEMILVKVELWEARLIALASVYLMPMEHPPGLKPGVYRAESSVKLATGTVSQRPQGIVLILNLLRYGLYW